MYRILKEINLAMITTLTVDAIKGIATQPTGCGAAGAAVPAPTIGAELALAGLLLLLVAR